MSLFQHLTSLIKNPGPLELHPQKPLVEDAPKIDISNIKLDTPPSYKLGEMIATRAAYGTAIAKVISLSFSRLQFISKIYKNRRKSIKVISLSHIFNKGLENNDFFNYFQILQFLSTSI